MTEAADAARAAVELAARQSYGRLLAYVAARTRDLAAAEDALAEAFAAALARWPAAGVPDNPDAWLLAVARRRHVDTVRRRQAGMDAVDHLALLAEEALTAAAPSAIPDERLALMFAAAHPAIEASVRAPLILQTVLGFDAATIASAFLVAPAAMGQRLVRAKARIREAGVPFRVPEGPELGDRLGAVLSAIYAAFSEGWMDPSGTETRRRNLATEAIWLGRLMAALMPGEAETLGLLALMLFTEARRKARRDTEGRYVPLDAQDMRDWDMVMIAEAETLLGRANRFGPSGRYQIEAAIQSAQVVRRHAGAADRIAIRRLYDILAAISPSPVVEVNRAVAVAAVEGPAAGLTLLDRLTGDARLSEYQPYWAARAGLLAELGQGMAAAEAYGRAIGLERDPAVRRFLEERRATAQGCSDA